MVQAWSPVCDSVHCDWVEERIQSRKGNCLTHYHKKRKNSKVAERSFRNAFLPCMFPLLHPWKALILSSSGSETSCFQQNMRTSTAPEQSELVPNDPPNPFHLLFLGFKAAPPIHRLSSMIICFHASLYSQAVMEPIVDQQLLGIQCWTAPVGSL